MVNVHLDSFGVTIPNWLKVLVPIHNLIPRNFFSNMEILVQNCWSTYLEVIMYVWSDICKLCAVYENSVKTLFEIRKKWLPDLIQQSNINVVFSNVFQNQICSIFHLGFVANMSIRKINLPKISKQVPLTSGHCVMNFTLLGYRGYTGDVSIKVAFRVIDSNVWRGHNFCYTHCL